ncbi:MAG: T9SS type A sorting domain-containing protein [Bacteroidota bacterium]
MKLCILLFGLAISFNTFAQPPNWDPNKIIDGDSIGTVISDHELDGYLIKNVTFTEGLTMVNNDSIYFYNCTFLNFGANLNYRKPAKNTIVDLETDYKGNNNITFDNCLFKDITNNGIVTGIADASTRVDIIGNETIETNYPDVDHLNLVIKNNTFDGWGLHTLLDTCERKTNGALLNQIECERCHDPYNKFDHAVYIRATEAKILDNMMHHTVGGPAISVRNSATVSGNKVYSSELGVGSAFNYWDQYDARGDKRVTVENNVFIEMAQHDTVTADVFKVAGGVGQDSVEVTECNNSAKTLAGFHDKNGDHDAVNSIIFRFNTLVVLPGIEDTSHQALVIKNNNNSLDPDSVMIYGNLVVDLRASPSFYRPQDTTFIDESKNLFTTSDDVFADCQWDTTPYNTILSTLESAWNFDPPLSVGETITTTDIAGNTRPSSPLSAGAYQFTPLKLDSAITQDTTISWAGMVDINSVVTSNSQLATTTTNGAKLSPGFTIKSGSSFALKIGCDTVGTASRAVADDISKPTEVVTDKDFNYEKLHFYPNPANGQISFNQPIRFISIHDQTGKIIYSENNSSIAELDISGFRPGIYYVRMKVDSKSESLEIV